MGWHTIKNCNISKSSEIKVQAHIRECKWWIWSSLRGSETKTLRKWSLRRDLKDKYELSWQQLIEGGTGGWRTLVERSDRKELDYQKPHILCFKKFGLDFKGLGCHWRILISKSLIFTLEMSFGLWCGKQIIGQWWSQRSRYDSWILNPLVI